MMWYLLTLLALVKTECPLGWHHFHDSCYLFSNDALNWVMAEASCRAHDARLAEVQSREKADYLINMAKFGSHPCYSVKERTTNRMRDDIHDYGANYWLGGRDHVNEGQWQWASTDQDFTYTAWANGEPNGGSGENCLEMHANLDWKWNDYLCSYSINYICEKRYSGDESEIVG